MTTLDFVSPMKAQPAAEPPAGAEWTYELKLDGYRCLAVKDGKRVVLLSAKQTNLTADYPAAAEAIRRIKAKQALLDGEIVAVDAEGRSSFELLQNRSRVSPEHIRFYAFDLLHLDGVDLTKEPLEFRKAKLAAITKGSAVQVLESLGGTLEAVVAAVKKLELEGIVAKRRGSTYQAGRRSPDWLKWQWKVQQEFVIGGFRPGKPLDLIVVGYYDEAGKLTCAGKVRQRLNPWKRRELFRLLEPLVIAECPFANLPNSKRSHYGEGVTAEDMQRYRWVRPEIVCQVAVKEWTADGNLRQPDYLGIRTDKDARRVRRERSRLVGEKETKKTKKVRKKVTNKAVKRGQQGE